MPLTDVQCRNAKPQGRPYRLPDTGGLHLWVTPAGGKHWRMRYKVRGQEKTLTFGPYPAVTLVEARNRRDEAKAVLRSGGDPAKPPPDPSITFEQMAREWHETTRLIWKSDVHARDVLHSLERDVFPRIGTKPLAEIDTPTVLDVLRRIERRGAIETAHRVRQRISAVFVYAIGAGKTRDDPAAVVKAALKPVIKGKQPALVKLEDVRNVLKAAEAKPGHVVTRLALRLLAITATRPGEIRGARWSEFDLDDIQPTWLIPAERMKGRRHEHLVPLPKQAREVLEVLQTITGKMPYAFPSARSAHKSMSENAIGYMLNRAGFHQKHVPHGWRAAFSSIMNERRRGDRDVIDLMLSHVNKDKVEGAYNRAEHMDVRWSIAEEWADILMEGMPPARDLLKLPAR